jgi:peptide/nickel transport system substrate-binding protein
MNDEDSSFEIEIGKFLDARVTRRDLLKGGAAAGVLVGLGPVLAACGGGSASTLSSASAVATPKRGGNLNIGLVGGSAKDVADPGNPFNEPSDALSSLMFEGLVEPSPEFKFELMLAEEVTSSPDATEWTVRVKPDILWHDGKTLTADDVVFSFRRIVDPKNPLPGADGLGGLKPGDITKVDERTVKFRFGRPNVLFIEGLANDYCHVAPAGFDPKKPVGTGAFKLDSFQPGQQFVLSGFKDYHGGPPYLDQLTLIEFEDPTARVNALLSGVIDVLCELPPDQLRALEATHGFSALNAKSGGWFPFCMRIDQKPFTDVRVRQAFRLIADRNQIIEQAYSGVAWIGNDMYSPYDAGYPKELPQRVQDLEQARSLLKQAGYDNDLSVELATSDVVGAGAVSAAQVLAQQAKGAGVDIRVRKYDDSVFYGDQYLSWTFSMDWWGMRNYLQQATLGSTPTAPYNETHWRNAKWLALVNEALVTLDDTKRNELVGEAATIDYNEGGYIITNFKNQLDAYNDKVKGLTMNDVSGTPLGDYRLHDVYIA